MSMNELAVDKPWLMLGDCLERMREIPDGSVDMVLCDLPYGTTACAWDSIIPLQPLWQHYHRVIKCNGAIVLNASQPFTSALVISNLDWYKYSWIWRKTKPLGFTNAKHKPLNEHEDILVFSRGTCANGSNRRMAYYPQGIVPYGKLVHGIKSCSADRADGGHKFARTSHKPKVIREFTGYPRSILEFSNVNIGGVRLHPTQKPIGLAEYLIRTYTNHGELVLDNTFGSCTTGVACVNTGRRFIGIERDPHYFDVGRSRIEAAIVKASQPATQGGL